MVTNRYFKIPGLPRSIECLIIFLVLFTPIVYLSFVAWEQIHIRTIPFQDVHEMQEMLGMDLRVTHNQFGFIQSTKGRGPIVYGVMFSLEESDLENFLKKNGLDEKLICDERSMMFAEIVKRNDPKTKKRAMREWIPDGFVPKYGFTDGGFTILVGSYENKLYVCVEKYM